LLNASRFSRKFYDNPLRGPELQVKQMIWWTNCQYQRTKKEQNLGLTDTDHYDIRAWTFRFAQVDDPP